MSHDLNTQATLSVSAATTPLAFSKFAIASLHDVDFAIAECKVAGSGQAQNMHRVSSGIGQADIVHERGHDVTAVAEKPRKAGQVISLQHIEIPAKAKGWHT